jgi:2-haloacid dehalogenase
LLHVAQSLFHDHVPAQAAGLPTVWINRRHADPGWGATPQPPAPVTPDWTFTSMAAFADAVGGEG